MKIKIPIIVDDFGDLLIFDSLQLAQDYLEDWMLDDDWVAYDGEGKLLSLTPHRGQTKIEAVEIVPSHSQDLKKILREFLIRQTASQDFIYEATLEQLVYKSLEYKITSPEYCLDKFGEQIHLFWLDKLRSKNNIKIPIIMSKLNNDKFSLFDGDLLIFDSLELAQAHLGDYQLEDFVAYDSEGKLLQLISDTEGIKIEIAETEPNHAEELKGVLIKFFMKVGTSKSWLSKASLEQLLTKGLQYRVFSENTLLEQLNREPLKYLSGELKKVLKKIID